MAGKNKKRDLTYVEFADHPPKWIKDSDISLIKNNDDFKTVIDFFVIHSPCSNISARGVDITSYNWKKRNPPKDSYIYKRILNVANLKENETLFIGESNDKTKELFKHAAMGNDFWEKYTTNRIAFVSGGNLIMNIFRIIRNCFAHCRFTILLHNEEYIVAMENGLPKQSKNTFEVRARLVIKLSTMMEWIKIIKEEYEESEKTEQLYAQKVEEALLSVIKENRYNKIEDIINSVNYKKSDVIKAKRRLITNRIIEYSRKNKKWIVL